MQIVARFFIRGGALRARSTRNYLHPYDRGCLCDSDGTIKSG
jgi:hypothetical protein